MSLDLPLVEAAQLARRLEDPSLRIVDCRWSLTDPAYGQQMYDAGHIPGAVYLSVDTDLSAAEGPGRHPLPSPDRFATHLGQIGIGREHTVVAYDDAGGGHAARLWWMLRGLGHDRVGLLDGGWTAWQRVNGPVTVETATHAPTRFDAPSEWPGIVDRSALAEALGEVHLVDARTPERYRGEVEPIDPVAGHIPTAINIPTTDIVDAEDRFLSHDQLASRFSHVGEPTVVYCGSGVTACHDIFAMHLAGIEATLYPGSWSDWSSAGGTVATGSRQPNG